MSETNKQGQNKYPGWVDIDCDDMRLVDIIIITMGIVHIPALEMYWSTDPIFDYSFIRNIMPRDLFLRIFRALHFTDMSVSDSNGDKMYQKCC